MANKKYADFSEEEKIKARERAKKWRVENPERAREYDQKKSAKKSAECLVYRLEHPIIRLTEEEIKKRRRACSKKWHAANAEYVRKKDAERYAADPEGSKEITRKSIYKRKYGLTVAEYDVMVVAQNGCCAICGSNQPGGAGRWHIDHCSKTGSVRRLLCTCCNPGLGFFKHDINLLQRAIDYLKKFS